MSLISTLVVKNYLTSKGFWGSVGVLLRPALDILGRATGWHIAPDDAGAVAQLAADVWTVVMALLALYGRWTAKGPLTTGPSIEIPVVKKK